MATIEEHEEWFLNLSSLEYHRLTKKWVEKNYDVPVNIEGYDQWLNYFKQLQPAQVQFFIRNGIDLFSTEAYAAHMRWGDILNSPGRIDKIYQAGLAKPKTEQKSISDLAKENDKLGVLYAIRDGIAEKLDRGTGARDTANLAREMSNILDQISEAERRKGPGENTKLAELTKRSRTNGARRTSYKAKTIRDVENG